MLFITGPLYSGKRTFAKPFGGRQIYEVQTLAANAESLPALADELAQYDVVTATEVGGGVVPIDPAQRAARTMAGSGRLAHTHHSTPHSTPTSGKAQSEYRMFFSFQSNCGTGTAENMANATAIVCKTVMGVPLLCSTPAGRTPRGRRRRLWRQRHC